MKRIGLIIHRIVVFAIGIAIVPECRAADPKDFDGMPLSDLSMEIAALQTLHRLEITPAQITEIRKLASDSGAKSEKRREGKASDKVRKRMLDLRDALVIGNEARIEELEEQLADLLEDEETDLDDRVALTAAATVRAPELLKSLKIAQVAAFLAKSADDVPEPSDTLIGAINVVTDLKDAEWNSLAKEIAEELKWQLGGSEPRRSGIIADQVGQFLKKVRSLDEKELEKQRPELEKEARELAAKAPPTIVLHNFAEHTVAELLSNPRLALALDALIEKQKEKSKEKDKTK